MTDNEIVKGLDHCSSSGECKDCPANPRVGNFGYCTGLLMKAALDLINRQKEYMFSLIREIKTLRTFYGLQTEEQVKEIMSETYTVTAQIKAEAIKEFAERLKSKLDISVCGYSTGEVVSNVEDSIDNLAKEMTEETTC